MLYEFKNVMKYKKHKLNDAFSHIIVQVFRVFNVLLNVMGFRLDS